MLDLAHNCLQDLAILGRRHGMSTVHLRLAFARGLHPFYPPSLEVSHSQRQLACFSSCPRCLLYLIISHCCKTQYPGVCLFIVTNARTLLSRREVQRGAMHQSELASWALACRYSRLDSWGRWRAR